MPNSGSPALTPFQDAVDALAEMDPAPLFDAAQLAVNRVPATVALYERDMFVPLPMAEKIAESIGNLTVWTHPEWDHDAIYNHGGELFRSVWDAS